MRNPNQVQQPAEKSINMACHSAKLWTHAVNNKKQASKGLMKIANDMR
jgi:hypothetical protein